MTPEFTRRNFLKTTTAASALAFPAVMRAQAPGTPSPNNRVNVAIIGAGGRGGAALQGVKDENIVAICDVDQERADGSLKSFAGRYKEESGKFEAAPRFNDYRKMLDAVGNKIDAVTVSTPDHCHYPAAMTAMDLGKHVYVEKPLSHTVWEAREMRKKAAEKKIITQMGNQGHAYEGVRLLKEWVLAGVLGEVREVVSWTNRPFFPPWREPVGTFNAPDHSKVKPSIPSTLNWDAWLCATAARPYDPAYLPWKWRGWWDFGSGSMGDVGCHIMDGAYWALELGAPTAVEASSAGSTNLASPRASVITSYFPARSINPALSGPETIAQISPTQRGQSMRREITVFLGGLPAGPIPETKPTSGRTTVAASRPRIPLVPVDMPPVKYTWFDGGLMPLLPKDIELGRDLPEEGGTLLFGSKATVLCSFYYETVRIIPEAKMKEMASSLPGKTIPRVQGGPFAEWLGAIKGGPKPGSNFEYSAPFTESVLLSNVAIRSRRRIEWDSAAMKVTNIPDANQFITKEYRPGWM